MRYYNKQELDLSQFIYTYLQNMNLKIEKATFLCLLKSGKILFLFDGLDEIIKSKYEAFSLELYDFCNKYYDNIYIISSRPNEIYVGWNTFKEFSICEFEKDRCLELFSRLDLDKEVKELFIDLINSELYGTYKSFLENPLLATIMLITFLEQYELQDKIHVFYENAYHALFSGHDSMKLGYKRDKYTSLSIDYFRNILEAFCILSYKDGKTSFSESEITHYLSKAKEITSIQFKEADFLLDLTESLCLIYKIGYDEYIFTHRSFQEYFAAKYITKLDIVKGCKIIDVLEIKMWNDNLLELVFNIDRLFFEDTFIITRCDYIINALSTKFSDDENMKFLAIVKNFYEDVLIIRNQHIILLPKDSKYFRIYKFVLGHYSKIYKNEDMLHYLLTSNIREPNHDEIAEVIVSRYVGKYIDDYIVKNKRISITGETNKNALYSKLKSLEKDDFLMGIMKNERITLSTLLSNSEYRDLILNSLFEYRKNYFEFLFYYKKIKQDKLNRNNSIEKLIES